MTYFVFRNHFIRFKVFSITDVKKAFPGFDSRRLTEWATKNYITKIINKWYVFNEIPLDEFLLMRISNCIYQPSYLSLASAMSFYQLIPEGVFTNQCVTSLKTKLYNTVIGRFEYRNMKPSLFFGYTILYQNDLPVLIAEKEKALLDYFYLTPSLKSKSDIISLRLNKEVLQTFDWNKLKEYAVMYHSVILNKRLLWMHQIIQDDLVD